MFQIGCDNAAVVTPTPIPRKLNPMNSSLNPRLPKITGNAWKERYRIPTVKAVLEGVSLSFPGNPIQDAGLPGIQKQNHFIVKQ